MPWTSPLTWAVGQLVTAAQMNIHVRDNLQFLYDRSITTLGPAVGTSAVTLDGTARNIPGVTLTLTAGKWIVFGKFSVNVNTGDGTSLFTGFLAGSGASGNGITFSCGLPAGNSAQTEMTSFWAVTTAGGVYTLQLQKFGGSGSSQANTSSQLMAIRIGD